MAASATAPTSPPAIAPGARRPPSVPKASAIASSTSPSRSPMRRSPVTIFTTYATRDRRRRVGRARVSPRAAVAALSGRFRDLAKCLERRGRRADRRKERRDAQADVRAGRAPPQVAGSRDNPRSSAASSNPQTRRATSTIVRPPIESVRRSRAANGPPVKNRAAATRIRVVERPEVSPRAAATFSSFRTRCDPIRRLRKALHSRYHSGRSRSNIRTSHEFHHRSPRRRPPAELDTCPRGVELSVAGIARTGGAR